MKLTRVRRKIDPKFQTRWPKLEERTLCKAIIPPATTPRSERKIILKLVTLHLLVWVIKTTLDLSGADSFQKCGFGFCLIYSS
jgi:hypothetical protein